MHLVYGEALKNSREAVRIYTDKFPDTIVPDSRTFTAVNRRLREAGCDSVEHFTFKSSSSIYISEASKLQGLTPADYLPRVTNIYHTFSLFI